MMIDVGIFGHPLYYGARHEDPVMISHEGKTERLTDLPMKVYSQLSQSHHSLLRWRWFADKGNGRRIHIYRDRFAYVRALLQLLFDQDSVNAGN